MIKTKPEKLSEETLESLKELGAVLMKIVRRLVSEGKAKIENGKVVIIKQ